MKILVTGGFGFIGGHTTERLLRDGHQVRVLDLASGDPGGMRKKLAGGGADIVAGDIQDPDTCRKSCEGMDVVIHHAGIASIARTIEDPVEANEVNIGGTRNLLKASVDAGVKRFIFSSSAKVYGSRNVFPSSETAIPNPETPYAATKIVGERLCRMFHENSGIETISLRYFSVYGPRQNFDYGYIGPLIRSAAKGERPLLTGHDNVERDFTYIDDVIAVIAKLVDAPGMKLEVFNVGSGRSHTLKETVSVVNMLLEKDIRPEYRELLPGMAEKTLADTSRMKEAIGFACTMSLEKGLARTVEWYTSTKGVL